MTGYRRHGCRWLCAERADGAERYCIKPGKAMPSYWALGVCDSLRRVSASVRRCCRLIDGGLLLQEGVKTENDHINLKVAGQDGSVVQFKIKRHTALNKLMKAYCERQVCSCLQTAISPGGCSRAACCCCYCSSYLLHV